MLKFFIPINNLFKTPNKYHKNDLVDKTIESFTLLLKSNLKDEVKSIFLVTITLLNFLPNEFNDNDQQHFDKLLVGSILLASHKQLEKSLTEKMWSFLSSEKKGRPIIAQETLDAIQLQLRNGLSEKSMKEQIEKLGDAALLHGTIPFDGRIPSKFHTLLFIKPEHFNHYPARKRELH